jgi:uncharacterized membrane protein
MPPETPRSSRPAVTGPTAQRAAEQTALRNVRRELDHLAAQEARQRKLIRTLVIVAVVLFVIMLFIVWRNVASRADKVRDAAPVQIPSKVDMTKKPAADQGK